MAHNPRGRGFKSLPRYRGQRPFLVQRKGLLHVVCELICARRGQRSLSARVNPAGVLSAAWGPSSRLTRLSDCPAPGRRLKAAFGRSSHHWDPQLRRPEPEEISLLIRLNAEFGCSSGEFELGADVEFRVSIAQVCFDGAFAEEQVPGDVRR
jgi:hypothetical protein